MKAKAVGALVLVTIACVAECRLATADEPTHAIEAAKALSIDDAGTAYKTFINIFTVVDPHPDREIAALMSRAERGDSDAFAALSFLVWRGYGGIIEDRISGKLGMIRAKNDGSAQAAFWIAETFLQSGGETDDEKADALAVGLEWLGIGAAMGDERAHDRAMQLIKRYANEDRELEKNLTYYYNRGLSTGASSH